MRITVLLLLSVLTAVSCAEDREAAPPTKRLKSVTWDLKAHRLIWVVEKGADHDGKFVPSSSDQYSISPDEASMSFANEKRGFTKEEAVSLRQLLDTLSLYCAESVIWWDRGEGTKIGPEPKGEGHGTKVDAKPAPVPPPAPRRDVARRPELVARAAVAR